MVYYLLYHSLSVPLNSPQRTFLFYPGSFSLLKVPKFPILSACSPQSYGNQAVLGLLDDPSIPPAGWIVSGNRTRSFRVQAPKNYGKDPTKSWPLIVDFHGRNGSSEGQWNNSQYFLNKAGQEYFVIYPLGCLGAGSKKDPRPATAWQGAYYADPSCNDTLFVSDLVSGAQSWYNISSSRIYASGKSNGGGFVDTLACSTTGDLFAAFAMASAALYTDTSNDPDTCMGKRPRRILESHGTRDNVIPFEGNHSSIPGHSIPNINLWAAWWAERNGCHPDRRHVRNITYPAWGVNTTYSCNNASNFVQQYYVEGLGHCWPSLVNNTDTKKDRGRCRIHSLDFTQAVLDFFSLWEVVP